jgi:hypothetical protein
MFSGQEKSTTPSTDRSRAAADITSSGSRAIRQAKTAESAGTPASADALASAGPAEPTINHTGMPDQLKTNMESLSGYDLSDVRVHYQSAQPAQLNALAYAQGNDIHVAPGQERHLPHEAWHVVQQREGRVQPTMQLKDGIAVNDDPGLESEADIMGQKALG